LWSFFVDGIFVILVQMLSDEIRSKLQDIVRGTRLEGATDRCSTVRNLLVEGFGASPTVKGEFESRSIIKEKQVEFIKTYLAADRLNVIDTVSCKSHLK
jgi:hypothetical protein